MTRLRRFFRHVLPCSVLLLWSGLGPGQAATPGRHRPSLRNVSATLPYSHALAVEARRQAFWRRHGHRISDQDMLPETLLRQQRYWTAQSRSRAMCGAFGGCS